MSLLICSLWPICGEGYMFLSNVLLVIIQSEGVLDMVSECDFHVIVITLDSRDLKFYFTVLWHGEWICCVITSILWELYLAADSSLARQHSFMATNMHLLVGASICEHDRRYFIQTSTTGYIRKVTQKCCSGNMFPDRIGKATIFISQKGMCKGGGLLCFTLLHLISSPSHIMLPKLTTWFLPY